MNLKLLLAFIIVGSLLGNAQIKDSDRQPYTSKGKRNAPSPAASGNLPTQVTAQPKQKQEQQDPRRDVYSVKITEQPADQAALTLSVIAIIVSVVSAGFAWKAGNSLVRAERAWVLVEMKPTPGQGLLGEYHEDGNGPLSTRVWIRFYFTNGGKTPAIITKLRCGLAVYEKVPASPELSIMEEERMAVIALAPAQTSNQGIDVIRDTQGVAGVGQSWVYLIGQVEYVDVFGATRYTNFGFVIRGNSTFDPIPNAANYQQHT